MTLEEAMHTLEHGFEGCPVIIYNQALVVVGREMVRVLRELKNQKNEQDRPPFGGTFMGA